MNQVIYAIRHNQHHLALVDLELRKRGVARAKWG